MFNDRLEAVRTLPLHQHLGVETLDSANGEGLLRFVVNERVVNPAGVLHGGVVYTLCDVCAYAGLLSALDDNQDAVTHDLHVSVLRPARLSDPVEIRSRVVRKGRSLCFLDVEARVGEHIMATARVTKSLTPRQAG